MLRIAGHGELTLADLLALDIIDRSRSAESFSNWLTANFDLAGGPAPLADSLHLKLVCKDVEFRKQLVVSGKGIAVLPSSAVEQELREGTLVKVLASPTSSLNYPVYLYRKWRRTRTSVENTFFRYCTGLNLEVEAIGA